MTSQSNQRQISVENGEIGLNQLPILSCVEHRRTNVFDGRLCYFDSMEREDTSESCWEDTMVRGEDLYNLKWKLMENHQIGFWNVGLEDLEADNDTCQIMRFRTLTLSICCPRKVEFQFGTADLIDLLNRIMDKPEFFDSRPKEGQRSLYPVYGKLLNNSCVYEEKQVVLPRNIELYWGITKTPERVWRQDVIDMQDEAEDYDRRLMVLGSTAMSQMLGATSHYTSVEPQIRGKHDEEEEEDIDLEGEEDYFHSRLS